MLHDKIIAAIRTGCAVLGATLVTSLVSWLTGFGLEIELDPNTTLIVAGLLFALAVAAYNFVVAWATENVWDGFGWLLGVNKPPSYITDAAGGLLPSTEQAVAGDVDPPVGEVDTPFPNDYGYGVGGDATR